MSFGITQRCQDFVHADTVHRQKNDGVAVVEVRQIIHADDAQSISCANSSADTGRNSHASSDTHTLRVPDRR